MPEYKFSLACIFPYKDRIKGFIRILGNKSQRKPVFWHIAHSDTLFVIDFARLTVLIRDAHFMRNML